MFVVACLRRQFWNISKEHVIDNSENTISLLLLEKNKSCYLTDRYRKMWYECQ